jgi:hypothetical protein
MNSGGGVDTLASGRPQPESLCALLAHLVAKEVRQHA